MPVYTYACTVCGARLEARQSFTDDALTVCPTCGGSLRKTYDSIGVTFNGSGFYRNDSRSGAAEPATPATKESSSTAATTPSPKPAATSGAPSSGN